MNSDSEKNARISPPCQSTCPAPKSSAENSQNSVIVHTPVILLTKKIRRKKHRKKRLRTLILPVLALLLSLFLITLALENALNAQLRPLCESAARKTLVEGIHQAVANAATSDLFSYEELIRLHRTENGQIADLEVDTARLALVRVALIEAIDKTGVTRNGLVMSVPLGNLFGWNLFSGIGIPVRIKTTPLGQAEVTLESRLEECGINQTRHTIFADVRLEIRLFLPRETMDSTVETTIPISERILIGEVPDSYWQGARKIASS